MKFAQAKKRLKGLAGGKYHNLRYEKCEHYDGEIHTECSIYIDGEHWYSGQTWEDAFTVRDRKINPQIEEEP